MIRSMTLTARISATAAVLVLMISATGCNKLRSRDQLVKGIAAFKNAQYEVATNHFQKAVELDPNDATSKLYLATAYSSQVVPNMETPENMKIAQKAIDGFQEVLNRDPKDLTALKQIASIYRQTKRSDMAKQYEQKVIDVDPNDAEANYTIGAVDWIDEYKNATTILAADGIKEDGEGNVKMSKAACAKIKAVNQPLVEEGLKFLHRAVEINPTYEDAMSYLNLTYRRQADFACGEPVALKASLAKADEWNQKAMGARKINEQKKEEKATHGVVSQ